MQDKSKLSLFGESFLGSRRRFLSGAGTAALSAAAGASLAGIHSAAAAESGDPAGDIRIFNTAIGAGPAAGDPVAGREIYQRCAACHSLERDRTGPRHCGLFGRRAGSVPGFTYSDAMQRSGIVWNAKTLGAFFKNPRSRTCRTPRWVLPASRTTPNGAT